MPQRRWSGIPHPWVSGRRVASADVPSSASTPWLSALDIDHGLRSVLRCLCKVGVSIDVEYHDRLTARQLPMRNLWDSPLDEWIVPGGERVGCTKRINNELVEGSTGHRNPHDLH